jgi:hypothetical protein
MIDISASDIESIESGKLNCPDKLVLDRQLSLRKRTNSTSLPMAATAAYGYRQTKTATFQSVGFTPESRNRPVEDRVIC